MAWIEPSPKKTPNHKGPWYVRHREGGMKQRSGPWWTLTEARNDRDTRRIAEREARRAGNGMPLGGIVPTRLLERYLDEEVNANRLRPSAADGKRRILTHFLKRHQSIFKITREVISEWIAEMLSQPTPSSIQRAKVRRDNSLLQPYSTTTASIAYRALHTFLAWCQAQKILKDHPMDGLRGPVGRERSDRVESIADRDRIIASAPDVLFKTYLTILFRQGQRKRTVAGMEGREIKGEVWTIPHERLKQGRDQIDRPVPVHEKTMEALNECFPKGIPEGPLFPDYPDWKIRDLWERTKLAAGITYPLTIHGARRTFMTFGYAKTQDLKAMMLIGGWRDVKTALKYVQHVDEHLKEQMRKMD